MRKLQESQLSVQALTRLASVGVFLLASWADGGHVALIAFQGALLAIPYTLVEALVGRPQSAGVVPREWDSERWALRAATTVTLPVAAIAYVSMSIALPQSSVLDRLLVIVPVLLQLPIEALFWSMAATRTRRRANLVPQTVAAGTLVTAAILALTGARLEIAAVPAQLVVLAWALASLRPGNAPGPIAAIRPGISYCVAAGVDLAYVIALPAVAGALAGPEAIVVLRAMDLAFGPFHVALAASTREDIVAGRDARFRTKVRALTVVLWAGIAAVVLASPWVRGLLAGELEAASFTAVALYCAYKGAVMVSTWLSTRHMIRAAPRTYLVSAIGSRAIAFAGLALALLWVSVAEDLFLQLAVAEALVVAWFAGRMRSTASATLVPLRHPQETP
ncbi:hypothetical protein [Symbioplanes lichenis]|uniref:hypothetical protein n=1 Tax=Symbioplanes lichenis TaxID=1629072 RepID=UPI0027382FB8|nr:hypothetical protein [Actinoplanes lichenis]